MSVSLSFVLARDLPLSADERSALAGVLGQYDLDRYADRAEPFAFDLDAAESQVLSGSVQVPTDDGDTAWEAIGYWTRLLADVREVVPGGTWSVHVDGAHLEWDPTGRHYGFPTTAPRN